MGSKVSKGGKKAYEVNGGNDQPQETPGTSRSKINKMKENAIARANEMLDIIKPKKTGKGKEDLAATAKASTSKTTEEEDVMDPTRPYGLPAGLETEQRRTFWERILDQVNDVEGIVNLREVSLMFNQLLEKKYVAAVMPLVMWTYFAKFGIDKDADKMDGVRTLAGLRTLSKASKNSVDLLIERFIMGKDEAEWFSVKEEVPILQLGASVTEVKTKPEDEGAVATTAAASAVPIPAPGMEIVPLPRMEIVPVSVKPVPVIIAGNTPLDMNQVLVALQLFKVHKTAKFIPRNPSFKMSLDLSTFGAQGISSGDLFSLLPSLKKLMTLSVSTPAIMDSGACAKLPMLKHILLKVDPNCKTLDFLKSAEKLEYLALKCKDSKQREEAEELAKGLDIPTLKNIDVRLEEKDEVAS